MKKVLPFVLVGLTVASIYLLFFAEDKQFDMKKAKEDMTISAIELYADFREDESAANQQFLNKTVIVQGEVIEVGKGKNGMPRLKFFSKGNTFGVQATMDKESAHQRHEFHKGETVILKCICMDYYNDVELTNCVEQGG